MPLFIPVLVGWATWQIVVAASTAGISLIALSVIIYKLRERRHMNNMIEAFMESGEIGLEEYIIAQGLAKTDRHARLVFQLMLPTVRKHALEAKERKAAMREAPPAPQPEVVVATSTPKPEAH